MDEDLSEMNGQEIASHTVKEEEMELNMTSQPDNVIVNSSSNNPTHPEETAESHADSLASMLVFDGEIKTEDCDDDDSEDSDR